MKADNESRPDDPGLGTNLVCLEKEAQLVLQELWAKLSANEKLVAYGVPAVVVGWLAGQILGSASEGVAGIYTVTINYFGWGNAGLFALLALLAAIVVGVVLYLKVAPNMNITWPMPVGQILLGAAGVALICGVLMTLIQITNGGNPPMLMYVADILVIGGGAVSTWGAYQLYLAK
jgi:hypothetical protein